MIAAQVGTLPQMVYWSEAIHALLALGILWGEHGQLLHKARGKDAAPPIT